MSPPPKLIADITNRIRGCLPSNPKGRHALHMLASEYPLGRYGHRSRLARRRHRRCPLSLETSARPVGRSAVG
jgi:hypothetical protein